MTFISHKRLFMGLCLLAPAWLAAQEFDDELQLSSDVVYWYRISNAAAGMDGLAMTDVNGSTGSEEYQNIVFMLPTEADDLRSQWKLTAGEEGKVIITNRATGSQIAGSQTGRLSDRIKNTCRYKESLPAGKQEGFLIPSP